MHLRVVTPYKLISRGNAKIYRLCFIIAYKIYICHIFLLQFTPIWSFSCWVVTVFEVVNPCEIFWINQKIYIFQTSLWRNCLLGCVRETSFIYKKHNKMHLRVVTPYKLISRENPKTYMLCFIIACKIYICNIFQLQFTPICSFSIIILTAFEVVNPRKISWINW